MQNGYKVIAQADDNDSMRWIYCLPAINMIF